MWDELDPWESWSLAITAGASRPSGYEVVVGEQQAGTGWAHSGLGHVIL